MHGCDITLDMNCSSPPRGLILSRNVHVHVNTCTCMCVTGFMTFVMIFTYKVVSLFVQQHHLASAATCISVLLYLKFSYMPTNSKHCLSFCYHHKNRVSLFDGMERWNGTVEWNDGMEWNGME